MNDLFVNNFINQTFNRDGNDSAISKINYYKPLNHIFQHSPIKEQVKKLEVTRMRNGYIFDTLTSVDIYEIVWWVVN